MGLLFYSSRRGNHAMLFDVCDPVGEVKALKTQRSENLILRLISVS